MKSNLAAIPCRLLARGGEWVEEIVEDIVVQLSLLRGNN